MKSKTPQMDWQQVVLNGGPPCFHVEGPQYCGRAERWEGHGNKAFHDYVSLDDLLNAERERCAKIADLWANAKSCTIHDDNPCCHVRTGAAIAEKIRGSNH